MKGVAWPNDTLQWYEKWLYCETVIMRRAVKAISAKIIEVM